MCPIRAMTCYCSLLSTTDVDDPVFNAGRFHPFTQKKLNEVLRYLLQQGGINQDNYASHSFRIGVTTTAAATAIPTWLNKTLGRWSSNVYLQ